MASDSSWDAEPEPHAQTPEKFATWIVRRLHAAGHQALFAGGCVRDQLLGKSPKDYDVATSATPDQVRSVFGYRRTLPVGAAFGVITVIGSKATGNVEVATFRCDGSYSDGRHPDHVTFSDARQDAQRRDFTINGLFFDPLQQLVLDYVAGEADLHNRLIRAIGCPRERFREDHLRMLRALRFATVLDFALDDATLTAIQALAPQIATISGERIAAEMQKLLASPHRGRGLAWLHQSQLLVQLLPWLDIARRPANEAFNQLCRSLSNRPMAPSPLEVSLATTMLWDRLQTRLGDDPADWLAIIRSCEPNAKDLIARWRLSNEAKTVFRAMQDLLPLVAQADQLPWSQLQPLVTAPQVHTVLLIADCLRDLELFPALGIDRCREVLAWPETRLYPPPYFSGVDLLKLGVPSGPRIGQLLQRVRQQQLDGQLADRQAAERWLHDQLANLS